MNRKTFLNLNEAHYDPAKVEDGIYKLWEDAEVFKAGKDKNKKPFCMVIPPPNVTGRLHMGHALNNTIQDLIARYKRMSGFDVLWIPGTDHAGIATQTVVKKQLDAEGVNFRDLGRDKFVEKVWQWKDKYGDTILNQLRKMGCSCDWSRTAFTMSPELSRAVRTAFKNMYDQGLIYRGKFIVNWCPVDKTALSDSEVLTKDGGEPGHLWHIKYPRKDGKGELIIATTRPETMLGDVAVAVHPEDARYKDLVGKILVLPIINKEIPIIADDYVDPAFGTGCVKITPAHDPNDFEIGVRHKLEMINIMNEDASLNENVPESYRGLDRFVARKKVVEELEALGLLEKIEDRSTPVGRSYRSKAIIEYRLSDQWFVKMRPLAEMAMERSNKGELKFIPDRWDSYYKNWLENVRDWCVSRQLWWGHRIPAWYNKNTGEILVDIETPKEVEKNPKDWQQDEDVLDTWFSSALWPYSTLGWPEKTEELKRYYPTDILVTGKDIIHLWVARMVMTGLFNVEAMPYSEVLINSIICAEDGETMSKSKGNGIDPLHIINGASKEDLTGPVYEARPNNMTTLLKRIEKNYPDGFTGVGADAMRYTLLTSATDAQQLNVSLKKFAEVGAPLSDKIWNAAKLVISLIRDNSSDLKSLKADSGSNQLEDKWISLRLDQTVKAVTKDLDEYKYHLATESIYHFFWGDFCDWYLEIAKLRLKKAEAVTEVIATLKTVLTTVLKLLHPIMPYITEEIWGHLGAVLEEKGLSLESELIACAKFPESKNQEDKQSLEKFEALQEIVRVIRRERLNANLSPKLELECAINFSDAKKRELVIKELNLAIEIANLKTLTELSEAPKNFTRISLSGMTIYINILEHLDIASEISKKQKELEKLTKNKDSLAKKLSNPGFVDNAPKEVVLVEKEKLANLDSQMESIRGAIVELEGLKG